MSEKIQKVLAQFGFGSRREIERWISGGRIHLKGQLAKLGDRMELTDPITLDKKMLFLKAEDRPTHKVLMYYKPEGEVCTQKDPENRPTVFENLPRLRNARWIMVGRLDFNTSGLLLFTTDGELANALMHPKSEMEREYAVRIFGTLSASQIETLKKGIQLEDGFAQFKTVLEQGGEGQNHWYHVVIMEGRNREIRRMFDYFDITVSRLLRVRFGPISLPPELSRGKRRELLPMEMKALYEAAGLKKIVNFG